MHHPYLLRHFPVRALLPLLAAVLAACSESPAADVKPAKKPPPQVVVTTLRHAPLTLTRELAGRTRAFLVAEVRPQVSGLVRQRHFTEGGFVKAGTPLYALDDAVYRAQYASAQAQVNKAEAHLRFTKQVAARSRELVRLAAVSAQDNDRTAADEAQAVAELGVARAALDTAQVNLAHASIAAPISGRIGKSSVTQGALVTADQPAPLSTIQQLDPIYVEVNQASSSWLALRKAIEAGHVRAGGAGTTVSIVLEDGSVYPHPGKLQFSDVTVDPGTGNLLLRATVPNPDLMLLPGMFVRAVISEGSLERGLLVPQQAVAREPDGSARALVVGGDGKVAVRAVRVSRAIGDQWLVDEGLDSGERVIVEGIQKAKPGIQVEARERPTMSALPAVPLAQR